MMLIANMLIYHPREAMWEFAYHIRNETFWDHEKYDILVAPECYHIVLMAEELLYETSAILTAQNI